MVVEPFEAGRFSISEFVGKINMDSMHHVKVLDWQGFSSEMALDEATVIMLYQVFAGELASDLSELRQAAALSDVPAFARIVHKIKGTSASYRALRLRALVGQADALLKQGDAMSAFSLIGAIEEAGSKVAAMVGEWCQ